MDRLAAKIRNIPDFPKPGIQFKDITPLVKDPATLRLCVHQLLFPFLGERLTAVVGMEARGSCRIVSTPWCITESAHGASPPGPIDLHLPWVP